MMAKGANRRGKRNPGPSQTVMHSSLPQPNAPNAPWPSLSPLVPVRSNDTRSDNSRDSILQTLACSIGSTVTLTTKTAVRYEGTVASTAAQGNTTGVTLTNVKDLTTPGSLLKASIFIASANIESCTLGPADSKPPNADTFEANTDINQNEGSSRRESEPQFRPRPVVIEAKWPGVKGFNQDEHTTKIDRTAADPKERELKAQHIAAEILGTATDIPHVREERGIDDSGADEEQKYAAAVRALSTTPTTAPTRTSNEVSIVSVNGPDNTQSQSPFEKAPLPAPNPDTKSAPPTSFRDFVANQKKRLAMKRQAYAKSEVDKRTAKLEEFSQSFKKPTPDDPVPILTKDEEKQRLIKEKNRKDAKSNQARAIKAAAVVKAAQGVDSAALEGATTKPPTGSNLLKPTNAAKIPMFIQPIPPSTGYKTRRSFIPPVTSVGINADKNENSGANPKPEAVAKNTLFGVEPLREGSIARTVAEFSQSQSKTNEVDEWTLVSTATTTPSIQPRVVVQGTTGAPSRNPYTHNFNPIVDQYAPLPVGWQRRIDGSGRTYYFDHNTHIATWDPPPPNAAVNTTAQDNEVGVARDHHSRRVPTDDLFQTAPYQGTANTTASSAQALPTPSDLCRFLILQILKDRDQQARICSISGDDAQVVVDYLDVVSHEADIFEADERRRALILLCKLAKSAKLFPRCYTLNGIEFIQEAVAGGSFAEVWKGKHGDKMLCLKVVRVYRKQENDNILRTHVQELALWAHLSHKNILPFYGVYFLGTATPRICFVSPWMERGNLRDYLDDFRQKPRLPFISDIVNGLAYLHGLQIVHSDLKAQNVLVSGDERALITDSGLSSVAAMTTLSTGGTTRFMAPELVTGKGKVTEPCDIWSFACLCYEVLTNKMPFYQYKNTQIFSVMMRKEIPYLPEETQGEYGDSNKELDEKVWGLLVKCWGYEPRGRPNCEAIQEALKDIGFQDNRPEATTEFETGSSFWRAVREKSSNKVDYGHVADILFPNLKI